MQHLLAGSKDSLSKKASYLRIAARQLAENMRLGTFRSMYCGQGIEFSGVREYLPGDDVRAIDWNVTARMGKPYLKLFEEQHELQIFLIIDRSASMFTGSKGRVKYETAAEIAALLALAGEQNESPVGAVFFDGKINFSCSPESGRKRTMLLFSLLDEVKNVEQGSVLSNAITGAVSMLKHHSLVFIISDFRTTGWEVPFKQLVQKHDVAAIRITNPMDLEMPEIGTIPFTDVETGEKSVFPTSSAAFKSAWRDDFRKRSASLERFFFRNGASFLSVSTGEDTVRALSSFFSSGIYSSRRN